jgi:hypothetical protein
MMPTGAPDDLAAARAIPAAGAPPVVGAAASQASSALQPAPPQAHPGQAITAAAPVRAAVAVGLPRSTNEVRDYIRRAAYARGMDPDIALRVALSEGGVNPATWVGDHGSSFGPFQLHYGGLAAGGNAVPGLGESFTRDTGLRASDLSTWRQQVDWSLDHAVRNGWGPWHGAAAAGIAPNQGTRVRRVGAPTGLRPTRVLVPDQFASNLSAQEAYAACGPVAAVAVARWLGRNPTVNEALAQAKRVGWTVDGGMNGIANEKRLLDSMRISSRVELSVNWQHVQADAAHGNPVIVSTSTHYWVIDEYDPRSQRYHVGRSGLAFRGGAEWMTAADIERLGGGVNGALFIKHPLAAPRGTGSQA